MAAGIQQGPEGRPLAGQHGLIADKRIIMALRAELKGIVDLVAFSGSDGLMQGRDGTPILLGGERRLQQCWWCAM